MGGDRGENRPDWTEAVLQLFPFLGSRHPWPLPRSLHPTSGSLWGWGGIVAIHSPARELQPGVSQGRPADRKVSQGGVALGECVPAQARKFSTRLCLPVLEAGISLGKAGSS